MNNARCVTLYHQHANGVVQSSFCFERSALKCAREEGYSQFVIAINGRILHAEGVSNPYVFINS